MEAMIDEDAPPPSPKKSRKRLVLQGALSLLLVGVVYFIVLPKIADFSSVWALVRGMTGMGMGAVAVVAIWNIATYSFVWTACLPGLTYSQAAVASESSTAVANAVPGGSYLAIALMYAMFHSWGFRRSIVTLALLISGIFNNLAKLALPVIALVFIAL